MQREKMRGRKRAERQDSLLSFSTSKSASPTATSTILDEFKVK
jgi:hypothetical protein